jgi:chromosome segregation ATPase
MARAGILYSHVAKAAAQLAAAGANPTVDTVRAALGDTGSKSTIGPFLKRWKAAHEGETAAAGAGLPAELLEAVKNVHERVQADAQRQIELASAEHAAALEAVREQLRECQAHDGMLAQSAASLAAELTQKTEVLAGLQAAHQSDQITLATLRTDNAGMERRLADRAAEVKALGEQVAQARVQFEHFQEAVAAQRLEDRRAFDRHAGRLEQDLAGAQQRLLTQQTTLAQQDAQLAQLRADHDVQTREARAARKELAAVQADREQLTRQLAEAAGHAEAETAKLGKVARELIEAGKALAAQRRQTELLEDRLAGMAAERDQLAQDKLTLAQDNAMLRERVRAGATHAKSSSKPNG